MDLYSSSAIISNILTFLLPIFITLCATVWMCGNKKTSTEKTNPKTAKKKEEQVIFDKQCFGSPEPPTALKPSQYVPTNAPAAAPPKKSSGETDSKTKQEYPQPQSLVFPSEGEGGVDEVRFKSETATALKTKTPAAEKKSQPTESTDLKTFDWMNPPPPQQKV